MKRYLKGHLQHHQTWLNVLATWICLNTAILTTQARLILMIKSTMSFLMFRTIDNVLLLRVRLMFISHSVNKYMNHNPPPKNHLYTTFIYFLFIPRTISEVSFSVLLFQ